MRHLRASPRYAILDGWYSFAFMSVEYGGSTFNEHALILDRLLWRVNMWAQYDSFDRYLRAQHHASPARLLLLNIRVLFLLGADNNYRCAGGWDGLLRLLVQTLFGVKFLVAVVTVRSIESSLFDRWGPLLFLVWLAPLITSIALLPLDLCALNFDFLCTFCTLMRLSSYIERNCRRFWCFWLEFLDLISWYNSLCDRLVNVYWLDFLSRRNRYKVSYYFLFFSSARFASWTILFRGGCSQCNRIALRKSTLQSLLSFFRKL